MSNTMSNTLAFNDFQLYFWNNLKTERKKKSIFFLSFSFSGS